ncbi:peptide chain release factor 2 [Candidatus Tachikawaea gelatinosa]|uniref:Peptide chain release factor 2 n=1 Tax=Candidatus Tachikawaea gelatinosa TaxID=1410383 RepID=A0A090BWK8_9ENTR|nr:peptide chain release factor 2 [Candidatus Tachikawaea gelatinosa]BAP58781.1 peptide chain release factor 2 [Candidatus Tachikawaea gelatinosa]
MFELNLIKNRIQKLIEKNKNIRDIFNYYNNKKKVKKIEKELKNVDFWKDKKRAKFLKKEYSALLCNVNNLETLQERLQDIKSFILLAEEEKDLIMFNEIISEINELENQFNDLEFHRMFTGKYDSFNCYIDFQSGSGGIDAQDWTKMLLRMYIRWAEKKHFKYKVLEESGGESVGIKSATVFISGKCAFGWLKTETGIHRLVRRSPFDSSKRRHTSFSSIFVYPEINDKISVEINLLDCRIDVYRASGAGGQHVNRTESAVRITHLPTGVVTQCQNDRSQHKNKEQAIKQMQAKLYNLELQKKKKTQKEIENNKAEIRWGNQIRSYILDDSRIKDLRTGLESRNIQSVLDGDIDLFIKKSLQVGL